MKRLIWLLLLTPCLAQLNEFGPRLVQGCAGLGNGTIGCPGTTTSTTKTVQFQSAVTSGNLLVTELDWSGNTGITTSISDTCGSSWSLVGSRQTLSDGSGTAVLEFWEAAAACSGADTVTETFSVSTVTTINIAEFTNVSTTVDNFCVATTTSSSTLSLTSSCSFSTNGDLAISMTATWFGSANAYCEMPLQFFAGQGGDKMATMCYEVAGLAGTHSATMYRSSYSAPSPSWMVMTVGFKPSAITITTSALPDGAQTTPYHAFVSCVGGAGAYTFSAVSGLPAWASVNSSTGEITGTPNANGTNSVQFRCTDGTNTANRTISLTTAASFATPTLVQVANTTSGTQLTLGSGGTTIPIASDVLILTAFVNQKGGNIGWVNGQATLSDTANTVWHRINPISANNGGLTGSGGTNIGVGSITYAGIYTSCAQTPEIITVTGGVFSVEEWSGIQVNIDDGTYIGAVGMPIGANNLTTPNYNALVANEMLHVTGASQDYNFAGANPMTLNSPFTTAVPYFSNFGGALITGKDQVTATGNYTATVSMNTSVPNATNISFNVELLGFRPGLSTITSSTYCPFIPQYDPEAEEPW